LVASSSLSNTKFADNEITPPRHLIWTFLILSQLVWEKAALKHRTLLILRKSSRNKMFKQWLIQIESSSVHSIEPEKGNLTNKHESHIHLWHSAAESNSTCSNSKKQTISWQQIPTGYIGKPARTSLLHSKNSCVSSLKI
jgi:hypothetical protein